MTPLSSWLYQKNGRIEDRHHHHQQHFRRRQCPRHTSMILLQGTTGVVLLLFLVTVNLLLLKGATCWCSVSRIHYGQSIIGARTSTNNDNVAMQRLRQNSRGRLWSASARTSITAINNSSIIDSTSSTIMDVVDSHSSSSSFERSDSNHDDEKKKVRINNNNNNVVSPLAMTLEDLAVIMEGKGRAQIVWNMLRHGIDPLDQAPFKPQQQQQQHDMYLGTKALNKYKEYFNNKRIEESILHIVKSTTTTSSDDGTTKLLIQLQVDGLQVETVIIPWSDRKSSTLCISSQVGCRQACTFCQTGRMGKLRSLSADEILGQVFLANAYVAAVASRQQQQAQQQLDDNVDDARRTHTLYPVDNIVFMGMGEPADNSQAVVQAARILTHSAQFRLAPRRITISTIAPNLDSFFQLGQAPAVLAWSVHASRNEIRKQLVPTTSYTMEELREALIVTLLQRSRRMRAIMLEVTLLDGVNDSVLDAQHLAQFCQPLIERVTGIKLVVNLIPWNDISATFGPAAQYRQPSAHRIKEFQRTIMEHDILCYVRTTRGDDESAACGQLATSKKQE